MALKKILVIDDERLQAEAVGQTVCEIFAEAEVMVASSKEDILDYINNKFYNLVVLDLRMDQYDFDGISLAKDIMNINPFAKILFVSKFASEYLSRLSPLLISGSVLGFSEKRDYESWKPELKQIIGDYYEALGADPSQINSALLNYYADLKNESDPFLKGQKFEDFVAILFRSIGFKEIMKRVKDKSLNEVDMIIRNDIDDSFLYKFGKYILVECKNKPEVHTDKNDYIVFLSKVRNTCGLSELGFLFTTSTITRNTYIEAVRNSRDKEKIVIIDNACMYELLNSIDLKEGLKRIIDNQVKDN